MVYTQWMAQENSFLSKHHITGGKITTRKDNAFPLWACNMALKTDTSVSFQCFLPVSQWVGTTDTISDRVLMSKPQAFVSPDLYRQSPILTVLHKLFRHIHLEILSGKRKLNKILKFRQSTMKASPLLRTLYPGPQVI